MCEAQHCFTWLNSCNPWNNPIRYSLLIYPSYKWASLVAQRLKCLPLMRETWVGSLGQEDPLEKEMATHSSILAWRIPWTEEPGGLQSMGSQRVGHDWATSLSTLTFLQVKKGTVIEQYATVCGAGTWNPGLSASWICVLSTTLPLLHMTLAWLASTLAIYSPEVTDELLLTNVGSTFQYPSWPLFSMTLCYSVAKSTQLFVTLWTAACQASLSFIISWSVLTLMSIESVMLSNHLILCHPLLLLPSIFPSISLFQWVSPSHQVAKVLELQLQHQSFQWICRVDFL